MPSYIDITGKRYGRLTAVRAVNTQQWLFKCDCGANCVAAKGNVRSGNTKSCGCLNRDTFIAMLTTHGHASTDKARRCPTYKAWMGMKVRCYNKNRPDYSLYGDRGIEVCERWRNSFENFLADMGEKPLGLSLDRINNNRSYGPDNCRWATTTEQARNTRKTKLTEETAAKIRKDPRTLRVIAQAYGVSNSTIHRIKTGKSWD